MNKRPLTYKRPLRATKSALLVGFPHLTVAEMERRSAEGSARRLRLSPAKKRQLLIQCEILNPDGTLNRPKMDHVPYGPQE